VVRIFPNRHQSCLRLVTALAVEQSEEWVTGRRYLDMEELREHRSSRDGEAKEVRFWSSRRGVRLLGGNYRTFGT
jgi:hypothetical protein